MSVSFCLYHFVQYHTVRIPFCSVTHNCLCRRIRMMPTGNNFRSDATYNNIVYSLAGSIVEAIGEEREKGKQRGGPVKRDGGRMSWEDELRMRLLDPLKMFNTSFYHRREEPEHFATPYDLARGRTEMLDRAPGFDQYVSSGI